MEAVGLPFISWEWSNGKENGNYHIIMGYIEG